MVAGVAGGKTVNSPRQAVKLGNLITPRRKKGRITAMTERPLSAVALFSGGGGLDLGFAAGGFDIRLSTDIDDIGCATIESNCGKKAFFSKHAVFPSDVADLSGDKILRLAQLEKGEADVLIGGPPCQAFSVFGRRGGLNDPRGGLVWEFLRVVREVRPRAFVFENVYGLASLHNGNVLMELKRRLEMNGDYSVASHVYELAAYGIPQYRKRVFIVGCLAEMGEAPARMPETHGAAKGLIPFRTVGEVLEGMPPPGNELANHRGRNHGKDIILRYKNMPFGMRDKHTRINKLDPGKPSYTIVVGSDKGGGKGHVHPYQPREVTPRESARLQTFPDWWAFAGNVRPMIRQVGNAVPPLFAAQFASYIKSRLFGGKRQSADALARKMGLTFLS